MRRFLILAGYLELAMYLKLTGKLNQYINSHYTYLIYLSMAMALLLALVQLVNWIKKEKPDSHLKTRLAKLSSFVLLSFPLLVGFLVPTVSLDSTAVASKGYHFPLAIASASSGQSEDGTRVQYLKPDTSLYFTANSYQAAMTEALSHYKGQDTITVKAENYMELMELIYLYPQDFLGKTISYTGFVYKDPELLDHFFLFRFGVIHCIADSGVYGLMIRGTETAADDTWLTVTGQLSLEYNPLLQQQLPVFDLTSSQETAAPSNPYVYRTF